ncbi:DUF1127 domain-containing protein [Paracoccus shanxieyensis]|uniref:DUF1127 domain-containing protein n=1 Tax=Paracoccus shanxieyensis TaxID=2675752 RepID=A0A6L6J748_9RHOB|nr:DUF1127 domain-containing protein [Paracoccus shanxieyensis]MTH66494.1 DUF1127 domain-containing protein [Paracoccus shanxieyensis]MTH89724.1 DUF1127 domain-containing protein [Paracoccus shanxieyensis]
MSAVEFSRSTAPTGFAHYAARLRSAVIAWNEARITRRELNSLTDRELIDIGLFRGDIERVARNR